MQGPSAQTKLFSLVLPKLFSQESLLLFSNESLLQSNSSIKNPLITLLLQLINPQQSTKIFTYLVVFLWFFRRANFESHNGPLLLLRVPEVGGRVAHGVYLHFLGGHIMWKLISKTLFQQWLFVLFRRSENHQSMSQCTVGDYAEWTPQRYVGWSIKALH